MNTRTINVANSLKRKIENAKISIKGLQVIRKNPLIQSGGSIDETAIDQMLELQLRDKRSNEAKLKRL